MADERCGCGAWKVPAVRYDAFGRHDTLDCFAGRPECSPLAPAQRRLDCERCGRRLRRGQRRFCSLECHARHRTGARTTVVCPCGATFEAPAWLLVWGKGKACSVSCGLRYRRRNPVGRAS